ncbi:MAG: hypothetical protein ABW005_12975 [Burkholderiaceae bacterium]
MKALEINPGPGPGTSARFGRPAEPATAQWIAQGQVRTYRRGQKIIEAGSVLDDWIAISEGAACLVSRVAADTRVAVAALWLGDVIGRDSPLGKLAARYDVTALVEVKTIHIPLAPPTARDAQHHRSDDTAHLYAATATRLQEQISMRLAGNGLQRLVSVLATLAAALSPGIDAGRRLHDSLALPIAQSRIGELSGLSRRQTWIYLGQLAELGWTRTARTKVTLEGLSAWLALMAEVERRGLECIATPEQCADTLAGLARLASLGPQVNSALR